MEPYVFISGEATAVGVTVGYPIYVGAGAPRRGAPAPVFHAIIWVEFGFIDCGGEVLNLKLVERLAVLYLRECPTVGVRV